jgi:drug/metabolite transporter (DMT)-like permease
MELLILFAVLWVFPSIIVGYAASTKGRSGFGFFLLSMVVSWFFAILVVIAVAPKKKAPPEPREWVKEMTGKKLPPVRKLEIEEPGA